MKVRTILLVGAKMNAIYFGDIINRTVYPEVPVRVEYSLSELGDTMRPVIRSLLEWGLCIRDSLPGKKKTKRQQKIKL